MDLGFNYPLHQKTDSVLYGKKEFMRIPSPQTNSQSQRMQPCPWFWICFRIKVWLQYNLKKLIQASLFWGLFIDRSLTI